MQTIGDSAAGPHTPHPRVLDLQKEAIGRMMALGQTHPVLPLILEYRKASSTLKFVNKLLESARACNTAGAGGAAGAAVKGSGPGAGPRIRQPLLQTNSDTGRLAMDDPSLQVQCC